jgi:thymidylate kinase
VSIAEPAVVSSPAPSTQVPREALTRFFAAYPDFVVLRNHDVWGNFERKGDLDLLVADAEAAGRKLVQAAGAPLWQCHRSYVHGFFYAWGHIDFLPRLEWRGAIFLDGQKVFREAVRDEGEFARPRLAHEALVSWFTSLLFGGFFKARYRDVILQAAATDGEEFHSCLLGAAGKEWGERLWKLALDGRPDESAQHASALRRAVWWRSLRRDTAGTLARWAEFWRREFTLRACPPAPMVAVMGPDGSGKSSVLRAAEEELGKTLHQLKLYHWYPRFFEFAQIQRGPVLDPHGRVPRGSFISVAKLLFMAIDWNLSYWLRLTHLRAKNTVIIFDRYYLDLVVDPMRYRFRGPKWLVKAIGKLILKPDVCILLDAPAEVLQARKQEVTAEESVRQREAYRQIVGKMKNGIIIDASRPLPEVVSAFNGVILQSWRS